jgi:two-component system, NarL family, response regulator NreC
MCACPFPHEPRRAAGWGPVVNIRVLIADDHGVVAEGLQCLIEAQADMQAIGCASDGRAAVRLALEEKPEVVLMDIGMPELNGTEAALLIRERQPATRIVMLSMYSDAAHVLRALQAGASGYVLKKSAARDVIEAIRAVAAGRHYLSQPLADDMFQQYTSKRQSSDPLDRLSSRERQVLQMLVEGRGTRHIAETLSLSPKTVETYRSRLMDKLEIHDLASLVRFALQRGLGAFD